MDANNWKNANADEVLDFWFPNDGHWNEIESHQEFWFWRMQGGADDLVVEDFSDTTNAAALGFLDHWVNTPRGRLALIITLDQFSRSVWRDSPAAFGQDIKAARIALDGFNNRDYDALANPWEKTFYLINMGHCEGPDHLARIDDAIERADSLVETAPTNLAAMYEVAAGQPRRVRDIITKFGRHPHRNTVLGRLSTPEEEFFAAEGKFPHNRTREDFENEIKNSDSS